MKYSIGDIEFSSLTDDDYDRLAPFLLKHAGPIAGYTPNSLFAWNQVYDYGWAFLSEKTLLIACRKCLDKGCSLLSPKGEFPGEDQQLLLENIKRAGSTVDILAVDEHFVNSKTEFLKSFSVTEDFNQENYVYLASDLAELPGGKYRKKRNHIQQASELYQYTVEEITPDNIAECIDYLGVIDDELEGTCSGDVTTISEGLRNERLALLYSLNNFRRPGNKGVIIRIDGMINAFSVYETVEIHGELTAQVHFEKALRSRKGLYQIINMETAKLIHTAGISKINREEDLGDEGLRKAKRSYYPVEMVRAWNLESL